MEAKFAVEFANLISANYFYFRYSNIFVTAPSPENLKTLFDFVCKGINALEYKVLSYYLVLLLKFNYVFFTCVHNTSVFLFQEHLHYDVVKSADPELRKATIQINVYKQHRQTIQVNTCLLPTLQFRFVSPICIRDGASGRSSVCMYTSVLAFL